jgi:serine/threonine-protein kinase
MDGDEETHELTRREGPARADARRGTLRSRVGAERYELRDRIGKGGMGEVIAAFDAQIGREVAIKRMLVRNATDYAMMRFFREASIQGRLDHPAIVPVYELGVDDDGRPFFAMKKLAGTTLKDLIRADHLRQRLLRAFGDTCLAVEFAHTRGVIHRDLKPHNIVLGDFGDVYVIDWGVAKLVEGDDEQRDTEPEQENELATRAGAAIGTLPYMSPEQLEDSSAIDARADVYALGCVLFEILAGEPLHGGARDRDEVIDARPSVRAPTRDIPPELDAVCAAATAPLAQRIPTARELGERVQRYLDGDRDVARRQQLARTHLATARSAFDRGDDPSRGIAMREAGRALALDPTLAPAGSLVGRLMLELPTTTPPEVANAMRANDVHTIRTMARASSWAFTGFAALLPVVIGMAPRHPVYTLALIGALALTATILFGGGIGTVARTIKLAFGSTVLVGVLAACLSPLIAVPAIAAVSAITLTASPNYRHWRTVLLLSAALVAAALVPWLLQSPVTSIDGGIAIVAPGLDLPPTVQMIMLALSMAGPIVAAACVGHAWRRADEETRRRLHLQAWQLGQLVSDVA